VQHDIIADLRRLIETAPHVEPLCIALVDDQTFGAYVPVHDEDGREHRVIPFPRSEFVKLARVASPAGFTPGGLVGRAWGVPVVDWS
jgi:hypothetical protein